MKFFQKTWLIWFLIIPFIILMFISYPNHLLSMKSEFTLAFVYLFVYIPALFIVGLILNIRKNMLKKQQISKDWKFWAWLIPSIIGIIVILYMINNFIHASQINMGG